MLAKRDVARELETAARVIREAADYLRYQADMLATDGLTDAPNVLKKAACELDVNAARRELLAKAERAAAGRERRT